MMNKAVILGATGEVGGHILEEILKRDFYQEVYVLGRQSILELPNDPRITKVLIDFNNLQVPQSLLSNADVFWAIGTDKKTGYEKVDLGYAYSFALLCRGQIKSFNLVSAMGANSQSRYRYTRVKGQLEDLLTPLDLGVQRFYRPAMLLAPNRENLKKGDAIAIQFFQKTAFLLRGPLRNWNGIQPQMVAKAMVKNAMINDPQRINQYTEMMKIAKN